MPPDPQRLRATVQHLAAIERPSASAGEHEAAEWIAARLAESGVRARVETERAHGTYWVPLGLMTAAGAVAGLAAGRGGRRTRLAAAVTGALAAAGIAEDASAGPHVLRRLLPTRETYNVVGEAGDPGAAETLVFLAHHDAARGGVVFDPRPMQAVADRFPGWYDRQDTSPQLILLVAAGPALVALGALTGLRAARRAGTAMSALSAAAFADIARSPVVPGANDNLSAVAVVVELARLLQERPVSGVRVLLVSTGSEESFLEGMRGFLRRHRDDLPPGSTRMVCVECVGSPELMLIEGEGMVRMRDYPAEARDLIAAAAERAGVPLRRGLRLGLATDALVALRAGYRVATIASITRYRLPANYHSPLDVPENVDFATVTAAATVCEEVVRGAAA
jgi:hypothetical protein